MTEGLAADFLPLGEYASYYFSYFSSSSWALSRRTGVFSGIIISEFIAETSWPWRSYTLYWSSFFFFVTN